MTPSVHLDEPPVPYKKRRCRSSKKKRLRLKKRASLEPKVAVKGDETPGTKDDETPTEAHAQSQGSRTEKPQHQEPEQEQEATDHDHTQKQDETHVQGQNHTIDSCDDDDDEAEAEEQEEMTEYERKRRANILRNQAYMKGVGMSIAKLAARTTIGNEAEKEAARLRRAEKRALRAAQQPEAVPQRLSLRIKMKPYSEHVRAKARMMAYMGVNVRKGAVHDQDEVKRTQTHGKTTKEQEEATEPTHKRSEDTASTQNYMPKKSASTTTRPIRTTKDTFRGGRQEPDATKSYDLQAAQRDAFANRIACMARKPVNMTMNTMSTDSPVIEPPCRDDSSVQLQQHEEASPQPRTATSPAESQGFNKQVSGPSKELEHQAGKKEHDDMAGYERKRRQDILRNQLFMQQVGGKSVSKFIARTAIRREAEKETRRLALNAKRSALNTAESDLPRRPARKLRRLGTEHDVEVSELDRGHPLDLLALKTAPRRHGNKVEYMDAMDEEGKVFLENLTAHFKIPVALEEKAPLTDVKYSLGDKDIAKVVPDPIRALAFLPRPDCIMVASGDKEGHIALWTPPSTADHMKRDSCAVLYRPHGFAVSQLLFPDSTSLISSSYDGTVREFDLWTSTLSVVCETGFGVSALAASGNPQFYYAGCGDGTLRLIDRRARKLDRTGYPLHEARINTLDQHPSLDYCIATASQDNTVCFWDKRRISPELNVPLATLPHPDSVDSAYFSPRNGAWLATVSQDSYINVYDTSILSTRKNSDPLPVQLPSPVRTQHNNYSGSWKGTKFVLHAAWDPKRTNQFVIGCTETPPRLQIFHAERHQTIRELMSSKLGTVNHVNVFHPHLDLIASGNAGGRVSLWRGKGKE